MAIPSVKFGRTEDDGAALAALEGERQRIDAELRGIAQTLQDGESTVDALEAALTRKAALELRARAVDAKAAQERARLEEARRAANLAASRAEDDKAAAALAEVPEGLLRAKEAAQRVQRHADQAGALRGEVGDQTGRLIGEAVDRVLVMTGRYHLVSGPTGPAHVAPKRG